MPGLSRVRVIPEYPGIAGARGIIAARGDTKGLRVGPLLGEAAMVVPIITYLNMVVVAPNHTFHGEP